MDMTKDLIQSELARLQLHPVNLGVTAVDDQRVSLQGSLMQYWSVPDSMEGAWLLALLKGLPDAAGPQVVMTALNAALASTTLPTHSD